MCLNIVYSMCSITILKVDRCNAGDVQESKDICGSCMDQLDIGSSWMGQVKDLLKSSKGICGGWIIYVF